ncbi:MULTISPECIES: malonate--CoA ligase [Thalassospira]|uniref:malonate--CoA ligase n=1 Tax=Thalassospira TaxID=168934 RepID=UPI0008DD5112|nr:MULTISPECIES: malonyl-CoA synthase [Thalassospira]MAB33017.1 malonyl-CoA synthase [Thalassospira sp.]MDM7978406.1 malonyl-CoA synthase [Thalassospira xiamenensis]OHZ03136.1 malonyl-CoA synthase [Thalassospira sp. MIT1004]
MSDNLFNEFTKRFPADRARTFLIERDGTERSFAWLLDRTARYATVLADHGVVKGDRVAAQIDKSSDVIALYLACLQLGAIHLPLNTAYTGDEIAYFLGDAAPRVFVCRPAHIDAAKTLGAQNNVGAVLSLGDKGDGTLNDLAANAKPHGDVADVTKDDIAAILYTSGTTGRSKGAMLTHGNLGSNALTLHKAWGFKPGDTLLHALPLFHTHGLFVAINIMLVNGGKVILLPKFDADDVVERLPNATVLMGVPTFYTRLLAHPKFDKDLVANMRLFVSGSAPLLAETHDAFFDRTGHKILERYGMTETCMNTSNPLDGERRPGAVGPTLPGIEARVCDKDGNVLPVGEIGVLEVRGPNVFKGYWQMPEKTASEFRKDGFFITGDLATIGEDGYVTIVGRDKDLIISGGFNVYPKEVEEIIAEYDEVEEVAIFGLPHPDFGEAVAGVIVPAKGTKPDAEAIIKRTQDKLAKFKVPKRIWMLDELPRNTMGKIQKAQLRKDYADTFATPSGKTANG